MFELPKAERRLLNGKKNKRRRHNFAKEKTEDGKVGLTSEKMKTARRNEKALPQKPNLNVKKS